MPAGLVPRPVPLTHWQELRTLVENRSVYHLEDYELNVFETHQESEKVRLKFDSLVITTMLRGKKVMHLPDRTPFDYLPGESVLVAPSEEMVIDFPEAHRQNPTQCMALAVGNDKIRQTLDLLNESSPKWDQSQTWSIDLSNFHLTNTQGITSSIDRLISIAREDGVAKDVLADLALKELLLRLMQTQASNLIFRQFRQLSSSNRMAFVVEYIHQNLEKPIAVNVLADKACMSESRFFRAFKQEFGISPLEFILQLRIGRARKYLEQAEMAVSDVALRCGFNHFNHFSQVFKRMVGLPPVQYRKHFRGLHAR